MKNATERIGRFGKLFCTLNLKKHLETDVYFVTHSFENFGDCLVDEMQTELRHHTVIYVEN
jgi:hypothetical protein